MQACALQMELEYLRFLENHPAAWQSPLGNRLVLQLKQSRYNPVVPFVSPQPRFSACWWRDPRKFRASTVLQQQLFREPAILPVPRLSMCRSQGLNSSQRISGT